MKKVLFLILMLLLVAQAAYAKVEPEVVYEEGSDFAISPRVEFGATEYSVGYNTSTWDSDISQAYPDLLVGATAFTGRYYLDAYVRKNLTEGTSGYNGGNSIDEFDRYELSASLGYLLTEHWAAFVGYRYGSTHVVDSWKLGIASSENTHDFDIHGPTAGVGYTTKFNDKLVISVNGGLAYQMGHLKTELSRGYNWFTGAPNPKGTMLDTDVDTIGYVGGLNFRYLINDSWDVKFGLDGYYFDFGDVTFEDKTEGSYAEETLSARFGITYTF